MNLRHEFVEYMPDEIRNGVLYVSIPYGTVIHRCPCGCGEKVVTPLGPAEWSLTFDGDTISLHPSVGNWSFPCKSHYLISHDKVCWARGFTPQEISIAREEARLRRKLTYSGANSELHDAVHEGMRRRSLRSRVREWWKNTWAR